MNSRIRLLDSAGLAEKSITPMVWLWRDYLATGMVTLLTSRWKAGKTTLLSLLLERLQNDRPLCGGRFGAKKAIVISEEPAEIWHARAADLGLQSNIQWICRPFLNRPQPEDWMELLRSVWSEPVPFVAIDTLSYFLPQNCENRADYLLQVLEPLHQLTRRCKSVLLLHHPSKGSAGDLSPRGSGALSAFVDITMSMDLPRNAAITDRRRIIRCTSRLKGSSQRMFELTADGRDYLEVAAPLADDAFELGWEVLKTVLEDSDGNLTQKRIQQTWPEDHAAPSKATLHRWLKEALDGGRLTRTGRGRANDPFLYNLLNSQNATQNQG